MKMTLCAGVFALATLGLLSDSLPVRAAELGGHTDQVQTTTAINVARIKSVLKLTPAQEPLWVPVEAALRELARRQTSAESGGLVRRVSHRVVSVVLNSAAVQRLAVAARPLIAMLDADQMRAAHVEICSRRHDRACDRWRCTRLCAAGIRWRWIRARAALAPDRRRHLGIW